MNQPEAVFLALATDYTEQQNISNRPLTPNKLGSLVMLFDIEYKRENGETYTGFEYSKHYRYPWTKKLIQTIDKLKREEKLFSQTKTKGESVKVTQKGESIDLPDDVKILSQKLISEYGSFDLHSLRELMRKNTDFEERVKYTPVTITPN